MKDDFKKVGSNIVKEGGFFTADKNIGKLDGSSIKESGIFKKELAQLQDGCVIQKGTLFFKDKTLAYVQGNKIILNKSKYQEGRIFGPFNGDMEATLAGLTIEFKKLNDEVERVERAVYMSQNKTDCWKIVLDVKKRLFSEIAIGNYDPLYEIIQKCIDIINQKQESNRQEKENILYNLENYYTIVANTLEYYTVKETTKLVKDSIGNWHSIGYTGKLNNESLDNRFKNVKDRYFKRTDEIYQYNRLRRKKEKEDKIKDIKEKITSYEDSVLFYNEAIAENRRKASSVKGPNADEYSTNYLDYANALEEKRSKAVSYIENYRRTIYKLEEELRNI